MLRRTMSLALALGFLMLAAPPAEAGIGSLIRAAVKAGSKGGTKVGAKAGAKAGAVGAKGAAKGAAAIGAGAAAQGVFRGTADEAGRLGVYVADKGDGTLAAITRAGDDLAAGSDDIGKTFDDLARATDDAGDIELDVFVDRSALGKLDSLDVSEGTRMFLANADGPSMPLRRGVKGPEVEFEDGLWMDIANEAANASLELAMELGQRPPQLSEAIFAVDPDCDDEGVKPSLGAALQGVEPSQTVVAVTAQPTPDGATVRALAQDAGVDLVVLRVGEVCTDGVTSDEAKAVMDAARAAEDRSALWRANAVQERSEVVVGERFENDELTLASATVAASHGTSEPPAWAKAAALCLVCGCPTFVFVGLAGGIVMLVRRRSR